MNYKTTNRLLKKGNGRAILYQVVAAAAVMAVIAPASYLYGVATAGEGVNVSLYQRIFSETVRPEGQASLPRTEVREAIWALGTAPVERATYNGLAIWTTSIPAYRAWEEDLAGEWRGLGVAAQALPGIVQGVLQSGQERIALVARQSDSSEWIEIFAYERGESSSVDSFAAAGLPTPPEWAEVFDYSGSSDTGVALAFRADYRGDLVGEYAGWMRRDGWKELVVPQERQGALLFEREGKRVTVRGMDSGDYTYVTVVVF
jgi:hypothetical protein